MLQLATPYANDDDIEGSLDGWVRQVKARYSQEKVRWLADLSGAGIKSETVTSIAAAAKGPDLSKYNIPELKQKLVAGGMPETMLNLFTDGDVIENARVMGLLEEDK